MNDSTWQVVGIIFSIALGIASLLYTALQTRFAAKQMLSATSTTMFGYLTQLNQILLDNADIEMAHLGGDFFRAPDIKARKAQLLIDIYLSFIEEIWYQHNSFKQYSATDWVTWERLLHHIGRSPFVRDYWHTVRSSFDPDFIEVVNCAFSISEKQVKMDIQKRGSVS